MIRLVLLVIALASCSPANPGVQKRSWGGSGFYRGELRAPRELAA